MLSKKKISNLKKNYVNEKLDFKFVEYLMREKNESKKCDDVKLWFFSKSISFSMYDKSV